MDLFWIFNSYIHSYIVMLQCITFMAMTYTYCIVNYLLFGHQTELWAPSIPVLELPLYAHL